MVTICVGYRIMTVGSVATKIQGLELDCLGSLLCVEATFDMDQKTLKKLVESITKTVKSLFFVFDKDNDNRINVKEWVKGLSVFLRGTFEEKLKFCFEVYYLNGAGYISREEIYDMLKNSLHQQSSEEETDEGIKELVDITLKKMVKMKSFNSLHSSFWDYDNDGKISFADFEKAVREDRLLLEVFGPCLPEAKNCLDFEALAFRNILTSSI
ncbi:calaxin-like isoform X3 [Tamandua tetradactyla]|uniref:calaxin-like isoform X3 n=1 Tax=Tamandua tetradactyla TaxID=48850 RepID=UPI004053B2B6